MLILKCKNTEILGDAIRVSTEQLLETEAVFYLRDTTLLYLCRK